MVGPYGRLVLRPLVAWLHLSDIHFGHGAHPIGGISSPSCHVSMGTSRVYGPGGPWLRSSSWSRATSPSAGASRVRAGHTESTEYQEASRWLLRVGQGLGIEPSRIFVVPGNHDVQRSTDRDPATRQLLQEVREGRRSRHAALADPGKRVLLAQRQANYLAWAAGFAPACTEPSRRTRRAPVLGPSDGGVRRTAHPPRGAEYRAALRG